MDTFANFLTRIRNGLRIRQREISAPYARLNYEMARVLLEEGFISNFQVDGEGHSKRIIVSLKYDEDGESVIRGIELLSRQSRRLHVGADEIPKVIGGLGVAILTTSKGVMTDRDARSKRVGGEPLCKVW
ncbi:30S ribosomal protein S8 [candidate division WOR-3 bacterium]|nr:30S ribosomal protein S8 [candidate division WOR-3 bacterium]